MPKPRPDWMDLWKEFCRQHDHHKGSPEYWQAYKDTTDKYRAIKAKQLKAWMAKPEHEKQAHR